MSAIVGQLRISRMSKREIAAMNLFFGIRHHKHIVNDLKANYGITEEDNTLFGEFGEDGEYIIPSISRYLQLLDASPHLYDAITTQDMDIHESDAEKSLRSCFAKDPDKISTYYSSPAGQCPQLYLNFHIYNHHSDPDYSYLIWNGIEKNNYDLKRAICYIECILERMGYTIEAGVMCIDHLNGDYTLTEVKEHGFVFTDLHANQFVMDRVCTTYHKFPSIQIRPYVIILKKGTCKAEMFIGNDLNNTDQYGQWIRKDNDALFLGIAYESSERKAIESICKPLSINPDFANCVRGGCVSRHYCRWP